MIPSSTLSSAQAADNTLARVRACLAESRPLDALRLLEQSGSRSPETLSAMGVCEMRLGRVESAIERFRAMLFVNGGVGLLPDANPRTVVNFATALLLVGNVAGCVCALDDLAGRGGDDARRIREVIDQWRASLPFARRLGISLSGWPSNAPIDLPFEPGVV